MTTGSIILASMLAMAVFWGFIEYRTLTNDTPDDHITAVIRAAWKKEPGAIALFLMGLAYWFGHLFWCACTIN